MAQAESRNRQKRHRPDRFLTENLRGMSRTESSLAAYGRRAREMQIVRSPEQAELSARVVRPAREEMSRWRIG